MQFKKNVITYIIGNCSGATSQTLMWYTHRHMTTGHVCTMPTVKYTLFVHGRLRRGDRRPVSSCVTHRIRVAYPSDTGLYTGFIPGTLL